MRRYYGEVILFLVFILIIIIMFFIAYLIGIIKETHEKTLSTEERVKNIEKILEDLKNRS